MKRKLSKAGGKALSVALAMATVVSAVPFSVAAEDNVALAQTQETEGNALRLWYDEEAPNSYTGWEQWALPLGNSAIGASVFGGVQTERIQLNEKSLWSGGPSDSRPNYNGGNIESNGQNGKVMEQLKEKLKNGQGFDSNLAGQLIGVSDDAGVQGYGYYLSYGNMYLDFKNVTKNNVSGYSRDLDLRTAVAGVNYDHNGAHYTRENFVSYPDNVLVTRLTATDGGTLDFDVRVEPDEAKGGSNNNPSENSYARTFDKKVADNAIAIDGQLKDNQLKFSSYTKVIKDDGTAGQIKDDSANGKITVSGAKAITIITSIGTDYKNDYPKYRTGETKEQLAALIKGYVSGAEAKVKAGGYEALKEDHVNDYDHIFGRLDLNIGQAVSDKTTDQLLNAYKTGTASETEKRYLELMLFQYGRYLTMGSSRETPTNEDGTKNERRATLPSNLQGIWVGANNSAWHSDYHMNVNLQMNYWPTYTTNMAECAEPLIDYVDSLREPGRITAKIYAGVESTEANPENGFMAHTQNNPYGWTNPGWSFDWGWSPAGVPWILQNCWEYYEFTGDTEYMQTHIYPMMKEEATLYDQMLMRDNDGKLVSVPSYSPEHGPRTAGNTYEHSLIWQLYEDTITAAETLGVDEAKVAQWKQNQADLKGPIEVGDSGQIKEWYNETTLNTDENGNQMGEGYGHRHISHMLGLYPGDLIAQNDEWLAAAKVSMQNRTDESTGWAMAQRVATWARLAEGDKAHDVLSKMVTSGKIMTNLWDTHPPFQIDGNFGYTAAVAEMLVQSNMGHIDLMPAVPKAWGTGNVKGVLARGNFEVDMAWADNKLTEAAIHSNNGGEAVVQYDNLSLAAVKDSDGNLVQVTPVTEDRISFNTEAGKTYTITSIPEKDTLEAAPTGLKVTKIKDGETNLTWDAVEAEKEVSYNVYRQIEGGEWVQVQTELKATEWTDTDAWDVLGTLKYKVSSVIDGKESELSEAALVDDCRNMIGMIDDQDKRIKYTGNWGDWLSKEGNYGDSVKFLQDPTGTETAELTFCGTGVEVFSCTQNDRGKVEISIDGEVWATADTYSSTQHRQAKIFSTEDHKDKTLEYGIHTVTVRAMGEKNESASRDKVELDAFNVLNTEAARVEKVEVTSASGMTTVSKAGSTLQMKAEVTPAEALNKGVTWSVATKSGGAAAAIDENGLLSVGTANGVVTVTATSKENAEVSGTCEITIAIPDVTEQTEIIEDCSADKTAKNPKITWSDTGWANPYTGEADKHHGGTKTETSTERAWFSYTFTGTGIKFYAQKNNTQGKFTVELDGNAENDAVLWEEKSGGSPQQCVFEKTGLENKEHTIKFTAATDHGNINVNIDYLEVFTPAAASVDKSALQEAIEKYSGLNKDDYAENLWNEFKTAYDNAVKGMNDDKTTKEQADKLAADLNAAGAKLEAAEIPAPTIPEDAKATVMGVTSTEATVSWTKLPRAESYKVYAVEHAGTAKALKAITDTVPENAGEPVTTTETTVRFTNLKAGTSYVFMIVGVNHNNVESEKALCSEPFTTVAAADEEAPAQVSGVSVVKEGEKDVKITWAPSEDPQGSKVTYIVYVDGVKVSESDKTEYTLKNADENKDYNIAIVAADENGNKAVPAVIVLTVDDWNAKTVIGVEKPADIKVKKGTSAAKLDLPKTVNVTLEGGRIADTLEVKWTTDNYKPDQVGTQTLTGELQKKKGVKIPDKFKTVTINVIVEEAVEPQPEDNVVTGVEKLADLTVEFGTPVNKLALPTEVKVTLDNETEDKLSVEWNTDAYKADEAGTYELTGTLQAKEGIKLPDNFKTVTINVIVEEAVEPQPEDNVVRDVEKIDDLTVEFGTSVEKLALPTEVKVTLDNETEDKLSVEWNTDAYKADEAGTYELTGTLQAKEGITIPENFKTVTIKVTVKEKGGEVDPPQPEDKVVIAVEKLADLTVKFGTPAEKLALPKEVKVTLDNKAKDKLSIVWNTDVYKADKAGTYKLTGTLREEEGITIPEEFKKVTINVTVEEEGKVPPTSDKEEGKNNSGAVQTGDDKNVWLPIVGLVAAIAVVAAVLIIKNKKKK